MHAFVAILRCRKSTKISNLFVDFLYDKFQSFSNCCIMPRAALEFDQTDALQVV